MKASTLRALSGLAIMLTLISTGCKKSSTSPTTPSPTPSNPSSLSATETSLLGNWIYDKQQLYNNGILIPGPGGTYTFNDPAVYHLQFNSTLTTGTYKQCVNGTSGSDITTNWEVTTTGKLFVQSTTYTIDSLTTSFLSYYSGSMVTGSAIKYSFHK